MLVKTDIESLIDTLDTLYSKCSDSNVQIYCSKLALLEFCGWMETVMDEIVICFLEKSLKQQKNIDYVKGSIIGKTNGFNYDKHFRTMLMKVIGIHFLESLEEEVNKDGSMDILKAELGSLWKKRSSAAHTSVAGVTPSFDSPSVIKGCLNKIYSILQKINKWING